MNDNEKRNEIAEQLDKIGANSEAMDCAKEKRKSGQISDVLDRFDKTVSALEEKFNLLQHDLEPILSASCIKNDETECCQESPVLLVNRIEDLRIQVHNIYGKIEDTVERIEL